MKIIRPSNWKEMIKNKWWNNEAIVSQLIPASFWLVEVYVKLVFGKIRICAILFLSMPSTPTKLTLAVNVTNSKRVKVAGK